MKKQYETGVLVLLLVGLAVIVYFRYVQPQAAPEVNYTSLNYSPIGVSDPSLRFDLLQKIRSFEYTGRHRNIFSMTMPPPETSRDQAPQAPTGPVVPPPPPALAIPVRFFGYSSDPKTGVKRAFFTDGDEVFILFEGDTLLRRYRLVQIRNASAEFEEIATQRRATIPLEDQGPGV
jgi:hypothetical protein